MDKGITNLQRSKYETLLKERLPELIAGASCTMEDGLYSLKCSMFPVNTSLIHTRDNTDYYLQPGIFLCQFPVMGQK